MMSRDGQYYVYVGTTTPGGGDGIHIYLLNGATGELTFVDTCREVGNPLYFEVHPTGRYIYSADLKPGGEGAMVSLAVDPKTGRLTRLNDESSRGSVPCYVSVDETGRFAFVANYGSGGVAMLPIRSDGRLDAATGFAQHEGGAGIHPRRQEGPHPHSSVVDPTNRFLFCCDLGLDKVVAYEIDFDQGALRPHRLPFVRVHPGAGPRHLAFHPDGRYAYVINELDCTITAFAYDGDEGRLGEFQVVTAIPDGDAEANTGADIHVHPSGRYLYGSLRGDNSVVIYRIDEGTGLLTYIGKEPTGGSTPRNFALDPSGAWLFAENEKSDSVVVFTVDQESGALKATGGRIEVPSPVCIKMIPVSSE